MPLTQFADLDSMHCEYLRHELNPELDPKSPQQSHGLTVRTALVMDLAKTTKDAIQKQGMLAWQYNTIGVSDAITMGGEGRVIFYRRWSQV